MPNDTQQLELVICRKCGRTGPRFDAYARCPDDGWVMIDKEVHETYPKDNLLGRPLMDGKYLLLDRLGRGGFGSVYRAVQHPVGREVAVKVIKERDTDEGLRARFFREARVIGQLTHDATVSLYDYGEEDGVLFMVLELIRGDSLKEVLAREGGQISPARAINILRQTLEALAEAHSLGLIHRDLKPANLMVAQSPFGGEKVKVLDFGIAKVLDNAAAEDADNQTREGLVVGTPRYMAPEQACGLPEARSDLYSAGIMLFQMVLGFRPFDGASTYEILKAHNEAPIPPVIEELPLGLAKVIHTALQKRPENRYHSAAEMAHALMMAAPEVGGDHIMGPSPAQMGHLYTQDSTSTEMLGESYPAPRRRGGSLVLMSGLVALAVCAGLLAWYIQQRQAQAPLQVTSAPVVTQPVVTQPIITQPIIVDATVAKPRPIDPFMSAILAAQREDVEALSEALSEAMLQAPDLKSFRARVAAEPAFAPYRKHKRVIAYFPPPKAQPPKAKRGRKRGRKGTRSKAPRTSKDTKPKAKTPKQPPSEDEGFKVNRL